MTGVIALALWTYWALVLVWWVGRHWDCESCCGRTCITDPRKERA